MLQVEKPGVAAGAVNVLCSKSMLRAVGGERGSRREPKAHVHEVVASVAAQGHR